MPWWGWLLAGWLAAQFPLGVAVGRWLKRRAARMSVRTVFYGSDRAEVGRITHELGDLVPVPVGAVDCQSFPLDVALPPAPVQST